jgi:transcriptional regulator with XRE-family HTH domain
VEITAKRLTELRQSVNMSQAKLAAALGITQSSLNRYEHDQSLIPDRIFLAYADYFDVSLDYIFGRTDKPEGTLFTDRPKLGEDDDELRRFIEFCFDPTTKMSRRLKDTLYNMMREENIENE